MNRTIIVLAVIAAGLGFDLTKSDDELFIEFMTMYTKTYRTGAEEEFRYGIFKKNLEDIRRLNKERRKRTDAHHDINMYTDLLDNELPINHHMEVLVSTQDKKFGELFNKTTKSALKGDQKWNEIPSLPSGDNLPKYHAYCGDYVKSNTERVKVDFCGEQVNQASCGCCYATALANLGQYLYTNLTYQQYGCVKHSAIPKFGVQRYLDITSTSATKRCCGGNSKDVMNAVPSFSLESDYPFVDSSSGRVCTPRGDQNPNVAIQMVINDFKMFGISRDKDMVLILKKILHHYGPILTSLKVSGTGFSSYSGGIFEFPSTSVCDTSSSSFMTDHEVVLMGWGVEDGVEFFIIRNSWSTGWGEYNNYIRIKTTNLCGIGWRIGDYVYPLNMVVFANTCILDKHCESCNMNTHKCSACKSGYTLNSYNRCVAKTVKVGKLYDCEWTSCNQTKN